MKVIRADVLGYCMGVRRAVDMAYAESRAARGRVYTIGPLIHNPRVLKDLGERGVTALDGKQIPDFRDGDVVLIRAHGVKPCLEAELLAKGVRVADATCPRVKASQKKAFSLSESGYRVFLAGESRHAEIIGIAAYAPGCIILADSEDARREGEKLAREEKRVMTALIGQTTISPEEYRSIGEALKVFFPGILVVDTICAATKDRQEALRKLCPLVDAVIVAGGRDSANTERLAAIAASLGKPVWLVESAAGLPSGIDAYPVIGLSAGASAPGDVVDEIEAKLLAL